MTVKEIEKEIKTFSMHNLSLLVDVIQKIALKKLSEKIREIVEKDDQIQNQAKLN